MILDIYLIFPFCIFLYLSLFFHCLEERVKVPWPVSDREALLHYFEIEYLNEDLILVLINTVKTDLCPL